MTTSFAGVRGLGKFGTDERPKNFREGILMRAPNGMSPIFALTSKMKKHTVDDQEFSWWNESKDLVRLRINGALDAAATAVVVDSGDPDEDNPNDHWGKATNLVPGDLLMVEPTTDSTDFDHEIVEVASVTNATSFTVMRGRAGTTAAAITDNSHLLKMGNVYEDGSRAPTNTSRNPIKSSNFVQLFKTSYKVTGRSMATRFRTGDALKNDRARRSFDHARDIEMAILFGQGHETVGANGEPLTTTRGIRKQTSAATTAIMGANWTLDNLLDAVSKVFDWESMAGNERIAFCGNVALNAFNKKIIGQSGNSVQVNTDLDESLYGMRFTKYRVPQGDILLKTHPLLTRHPLYGASMFIIDPTAIRWCPLRGRDMMFYDNVEENDEDAKRGYWQTDGGIRVDHNGLTCGYIGGVK